jgi:hypothetical protein
VQLIVALAMHGLLGVHAAPCVHGTQLADVPLHTPTAPLTLSVQPVPAALNAPSVQTGAPLEQTMVAPFTQGPLAVHGAPDVHGTQLPDVPLHTPVAPVLVVQLVPADLYVWSVQTGAPEEHTMVPVAPQASVGVQLAPGVHALQVPVESHAPLAPVDVVHAVPTAAVCVTVQTGVPEAQLYEAAVAQVFVDVHDPPHRWKDQTTRIVPFPWLVQSMV